MYIKSSLVIFSNNGYPHWFAHRWPLPSECKSKKQVFKKKCILSFSMSSCGTTSTCGKQKNFQSNLTITDGSPFWVMFFPLYRGGKACSNYCNLLQELITWLLADGFEDIYKWDWLCLLNLLKRGLHLQLLQKAVFSLFYLLLCQNIIISDQWLPEAKSNLVILWFFLWTIARFVGLLRRLWYTLKKNLLIGSTAEQSAVYRVN